MSARDERTSADMLLVFARRARLRGAGADAARADRQLARDAAPATADLSDVLFTEEDEIIDDPTASPDPARQAKGGIDCFRSLATVSLARLAWSGAIDHGILHEALACAPVQPVTRAARTIRFSPYPALRAAPAGEPSLHVRLGDDDVEAVDRVFDRVEESVGARLAAAVLLPDGLLGAPSGATMAATQALTSYRASALVAAWREVMGAPGLPEVVRDRDSAAVRLLSVLRALLGEA